VVSMVMDHRAADDDVGQLTRPIEKNYRCKAYTPPAGEESFHLEEDDGVGVPGTDLNGLDVSGENFASDSNPRRRARNGTPTKGRWGWCR
jgi:hypothetical protein